MISMRVLAPTAFAALALCGSVASAATFNLTINGQSPQALIDVINKSNSNGEADTINISGSVNFTEANNSIYGPTGFPVIANDGGLTINGAGNFFIGRINNTNNPKVRIFAMAPGANLTLNNVRFANGSAGAGSGGSGDAATNRGGAIYNGNGGTLTLNGCDFDYNTAVSGACIYNGPGARVLATGGIFRFNTADSDGGAIFNQGGFVSFNRVTFGRNEAKGNTQSGGAGGAICNGNPAGVQTGGTSDLYATDCLFDSQSGGNSARRGGAIANFAGNTAFIINSTFDSNGATLGGALYVESTLTVVSSLFSNNSASSQGGAVYVKHDVQDQGFALAIRNSTLAGNRADVAGGAVRNAGGGGTSLENCTLTDNSVFNSNTGGALSNSIAAGTVTRVSNTIIAGNRGADVSYDATGPEANPRTIQSGGYNLIGTGSAASSFDATGDINNVGDPRLNRLANNGGPTQTVAPMPDSPAVNAGDPAIRGDNQFDQRGPGFPRVRDGRIDIGAYEVQSGPPVISVTLTPRFPRTNDVLTANVSATADGDSVSYNYQWSRNGTVIPGETARTLNLSKSGNGDKGDLISVVVRATNSQGTSPPVSAQVAIVNSAPVAVSSQGEVPADTEKGFPLTAFDADGDIITFKRVGGPRNGVTADIRVDPLDGVTKLFYKSRPFYGGVDIIRFVAIDSEGKISNESTLGINVQYTPPPPANRAPIAGDTNINTVVGASEVKGLLGSDPDGDAITFRIVNNARFGRSEIRRDTDGQFRLFYTSLPRFFGPDRVTYIVTDSRGKESNLATVNINFINRSPVAQNNDLSVASGEPVSQFLFADDPDNDAVTFRLVNNPRFGAGDIRRDAQGKWRVFYRSVNGYVGPDRITFIAIDPFGKESQVATANINVVRVSSSPSAIGAGAVKAPSGGGS